MRDRDLDDILKKAGLGQPRVDDALVDRISRDITSGLRPAKALPPVWLLAGMLVALCWAVAIAGTCILGAHGVRKMDAAEMGLIFPFLAAFSIAAGLVCVAEAIPGSRLPMSPGWLAVFGSLTMIAIFALLFRDYGTERFVSQGVKCLVAGLAHAVPTSFGTWWVLRRGFPVNAFASGFSRGILAGLAGLILLELHCPNFEAPHVMVWHIAVLPVSGTLGALAARRA